MIIKNASVFEENGTFVTKDVCIEGGQFAESASEDTVIDACTGLGKNSEQGLYEKA